MENSTSIKDRIVQIADYKNIKKDVFFEELGQSYSNYRGKSTKSAPSAEVIAEISTKYPDVNLIWLLTGKGSMIREEIENSSEMVEKNGSCVENLSKDLLLKILEMKDKEIAMKDEIINHLKDHIQTLKNMPEMGNTIAVEG